MDQYQLYKLLRAQGVPAHVAIQQAFPKGLPSQEGMLKDAANKQQNDGLAGLGGMLAAALGIKYGGSALSSMGKSVGGLLSSGTGSNLAATEAANTAWNSGAMAATDTASTGASGLGIAGLAPYAGVAGGLALGARGIKDLIDKKETKGLGGWGGRVTLGLATGGISEIARAFGLGEKPRTEVEDERLQALKDKGLLPADFQINKESRSREQQLNDALASGQTVNQDWLRTGDEKYLTGQDLQGYAKFLEKDSRINDAGLAARSALANDYLKAGAVNEHHGTIDLDENKYNAWKQSQAPGATLASSFTSFDPNSVQYKNLSKADKDVYWDYRNNQGTQQVATPAVAYTKPGTMARLPGFENMSDDDWNKVAPLIFGVKK